ncbi:MAG: YcjX family protein [Phycisphaerae bacterium]
MKKIITKTRNIAVTGIARGGKTVFLTSLLAQLEEFDNANFSFANNSSIQAFKELRPSAGRIRQFPLDRYRDFLAMRGSWPEKTTDRYAYSCEFWRSDWRMSKQRLNFFDFPGERIADAAIAAFPDYGKWSDHLLQHFKNHKSLADIAEPFFKHLELAQGEAGDFVALYKQTLAKLILSYKPLITPSTFLLGTDGRAARKGTVQELAESRPSGVDGASEFAPLSAACRTARPEIAREMEQNYKLYRKQVVMPVFKELGRNKRLIVLIDIPTLLSGGVGQYNDNRQLLSDLFDALRPDSSIGKQILSVIQFWKGPLEKVAFVASKADMMYNDDIESGRVETLLRQLTSKAKKVMPDVEYKWFVCSACKSTVKGSKPYTLKGRPALNNPEQKIMEFEVSQVPEHWPDSWEPGDFRFRSIMPEVPRNTQKPPRHIRLDAVFDFIVN